LGTPTKAELQPQFYDNTTTPPIYNPEAAGFQRQPHHNTPLEYNPYAHAVEFQAQPYHNTSEAADYFQPQPHHNTPLEYNPYGQAVEFQPQPYHNTGEATDYFQPRLPTSQYNYIAQAMAAVLPPNSGPPPQPNATYVSLHPDTYLPPFLSSLTNP
jgi:hypothetical protein